MDRSDASVHHVRRGDPIDARFGMCHGHPAEDVDGFVIRDFAVDDEPVMAVDGIGIEGDVGLDADIRECLFEGTDRARNDAFRVEGFGRTVVLFRRIAEEVDGPDAQLPELDLI